MITKIEQFCFWEINRIGINLIDENGKSSNGVDLTIDEATELATGLIKSIQEYNKLNSDYQNYVINNLQRQLDNKNNT